MADYTLLLFVIPVALFFWLRWGIQTNHDQQEEVSMTRNGSKVQPESDLPQSLFDQWVDFHLKNLAWLNNEIVFRIERLPFQKDALLSSFSEEIDSFRRNGMLQLSMDSVLVHLNIIMRFQDVPDDFPLLTHRLLILNAASTRSDDQVKFITDNPALLDSLEVSGVERKLVQSILDEATVFCQQNRLPLDRFKMVNMTTYASLGT